MLPRPVSCSTCGKTLNLTTINLDASGDGFRLQLTGIPVAHCRKCEESMMIAEAGGITLFDIITSTMNALEVFAPKPMGEPDDITLHCRTCGAQITGAVDAPRSHFRSSAPFKSGEGTLGVDFFGDSVTCPKCFLKHTWMPGTLYHKIKDSVSRAADVYVRH